jgi:hypothetical protein
MENRLGCSETPGSLAFYQQADHHRRRRVIVTDRDDWADVMRSLRNQPRAPGDTWLQHAPRLQPRMDE